MNFRLVQKSVTLNDPERRSGPYFALFHRICVRLRRKTMPISRFQNLPLIVNGHINTICAIIQRVFGQTTGGNSLHFRLQLPTPMSLDEFLGPAGRPIVQYGGLDGRVHCNYGGLIKLVLMGIGAGISVDA